MKTILRKAFSCRTPTRFPLTSSRAPPWPARPRRRCAGISVGLATRVPPSPLAACVVSRLTGAPEYAKSAEAWISPQLSGAASADRVVAGGREASPQGSSKTSTSSPRRCRRKAACTLVAAALRRWPHWSGVHPAGACQRTWVRPEWRSRNMEGVAVGHAEGHASRGVPSPAVPSPAGLTTSTGDARHTSILPRHHLCSLRTAIRATHPARSLASTTSSRTRTHAETPAGKVSAEQVLAAFGCSAEQGESASNVREEGDPD